MSKGLRQRTAVAAAAVLKADGHTNKRKTFDDRTAVFLQTVCVRVPRCSIRMLRVRLEHGLDADGGEACLFVPDLKRGRRVNFEPTVEHYERLLREAGADGVKRVIPMNQLKTEYDQFELKRRLAGQYDAFLVDGRIAGHVSHLLGKTFLERRKAPVPVKMGARARDLKTSIEDGLKKTTMILHGRGDTHAMQIGHTGMTATQIAENAETALRQLAREFPGGAKNLRAVHLKTARSVAVPLYVSLRKNDVSCPRIRPLRPKRSAAVKGELSTLPSTDVTVNADGVVLLSSSK